MPLNDPPEITSSPATADTAKTFALYRYQVLVDEVDGDDIQYALLSAPSGMEISTDGLITWSPQWGTATSGVVNVWVSDGNEAYDLQAFSIDVLQIDCLGIPDGTAMSDDCNICDDTPEFYADCFGEGCEIMDCNGVCHGDALYQTYYVDVDEDGLGQEIGVGDHCSAAVDNVNWADNSTDEDDTCYSNEYNGDGDCCVTDSSDNPSESPSCLVAYESASSSLVGLQSNTIELTFSDYLEPESNAAIDIAATHGDALSFVASVNSSDNTIMEIELSNLTSRDTLVIAIDASALTSIAGHSGDSDGSLTIHTKTLGDYDGDDDVDEDDAAMLLTYWKDDTQFDNELGPVSGLAPHLLPEFDDNWDLDDLMAFVSMYNWSPKDDELQFVEDSGTAPKFTIMDDMLSMSFPDYEEDIQYVWYGVNMFDDDISFTPMNLSQEFELSLNRTKLDGNVEQTLLINFESIYDGSDLLLGTFQMDSRNKIFIELQYKIKSKTGLISSGTLLMNHIPKPQSFELSPAYPNPFNPVTVVNYGLPEDAKLTLFVYDLQGRLVEKLQDGLINAGYHEVKWNASAYGSGIYFIKINASNMNGRSLYSKTQKIMLVK